MRTCIRILSLLLIMVKGQPLKCNVIKLRNNEKVRFPLPRLRPRPPKRNFYYVNKIRMRENEKKQAAVFLIPRRFLPENVEKKTVKKDFYFHHSRYAYGP